MAKQTRNTFGAMNSTLRSLGFVRARHGESVVFTYPDGGPIILLPAYKSSDAVKPIHRAMVTKQLMDAGLVKAGYGQGLGYAKAAPKCKTPTRFKPAPKRSIPPKRGR
jgi:hypothetical protein